MNIDRFASIIIAIALIVLVITMIPKEAERIRLLKENKILKIQVMELRQEIRWEGILMQVLPPMVQDSLDVLDEKLKQEYRKKEEPR